MKRTLFFLALMMLSLGASAQTTGWGESPVPSPLASAPAPNQISVQPGGILSETFDYAKVLSYSLIPGAPVARQTCAPAGTTELSSGNNPLAAVAGGAAGALVGSRFGGGHGKDALTVIGAIGGTIAGNALGSTPSAAQQPSCKTVYEPGPGAGYQVVFEYQGKQLTTTTRTIPGERLRIRNTVIIDSLMRTQ